MIHQFFNFIQANLFWSLISWITLVIYFCIQFVIPTFCYAFFIVFKKYILFQNISCCLLSFILVLFYVDFFSGRLVFERIRDKSASVLSGSKTVRALPENFTSEEVPESAKETCRNWFYKVASIRELIPRLYLFLFSSLQNCEKS